MDPGTWWGSRTVPIGNATMQVNRSVGAEVVRTLPYSNLPDLRELAGVAPAGRFSTQSAEAEDSQQSLVDPPDLFGTGMTD
jgi:hypothetical protein